jgi:plastocyanin
MTGNNMGIQNMPGMMGNNMGIQNMMELLAKRMTGMENMLIIMAKHMEIQNMTTIQGRPVSDAGQSKTVSIVKGASDPSSFEPYNPSRLSVPVGTAVTWIDNDNVVHTVTDGNSSGNIPPNGFDSGIVP